MRSEERGDAARRREEMQRGERREEMLLHPTRLGQSEHVTRDTFLSHSNELTWLISALD